MKTFRRTITIFPIILLLLLFLMQSIKSGVSSLYSGAIKNQMTTPVSAEKIDRAMKLNKISNRLTPDNPAFYFNQGLLS